MCYIWKNPTRESEEFKPSLLEKLPRISFCNVTGGEPFLREDLEEIVSILQKKASRLVISTNGYFTERIISLARKNKKIGIRISLEGLPAANDELRGMKDGFDHGLRTLLELKKIGLRDIGFGITVSDRNAKDMLELSLLAKYLKIEFATAVVHNSYYFHKSNNTISKKEDVIACFEELIQEFLKSWKIKNWYRAYFNQGLINYIQGNPRDIPCGGGSDLFFLDPWGEIRPCNGMEEGIWCESMGNLNKSSFEEIWSSNEAHDIRNRVKTCPKNCWMIGTATPAIKKHPLKPSLWVFKNKFRAVFG
jgi:radical SAM protein with 4Fe4S-binding SPASM domain